MIFFPRDPRHPPYGRIDEVIYYGALGTMADWHVYACDFDTGELIFLDPALLPGLPPTGAAGGDLTGTYPDPSIGTCPDGALSANVPLMTAGVLPAVNGSLLTNLPAASSVVAGAPNSSWAGVALLDPAGTVFLTLGVDVPDCNTGATQAVVVACGASALGTIVSSGLVVPAGTISITSLLGAADSGLQVNFILCYG